MFYTLGRGRFAGDGAHGRGDFVAKTVRGLKLRRATAAASGHALTSRLQATEIAIAEHTVSAVYSDIPGIIWEEAGGGGGVVNEFSSGRNRWLRFLRKRRSYAYIYIVLPYV